MFLSKLVGYNNAVLFDAYMTGGKSCQSLSDHVQGTTILSDVTLTLQMVEVQIF